jgi:hypothetical protein
VLQFLQRSVGWDFDRKALRYACQVRKQLAKMTGEAKKYDDSASDKGDDDENSEESSRSNY